MRRMIPLKRSVNLLYNRLRLGMQFSCWSVLVTIEVAIIHASVKRGTSRMGGRPTVTMFCRESKKIDAASKI